ncbi:MAG: hypothetical protein IT260_04515 [Saprospiraceae bacterium]|nr:hypothetical protein [Saprospiraceae bacterium]
MKSISKNVEEFIQQNRTAFDTCEPGERVWHGVEKTLDRLPSADRLERYLLNNRLLLDTASPSDRVWSGISAALDGAAPGPADPLEQFIVQHRDAFDSETPDQRVWAAVDQALPAVKGKVIGVQWRRNFLQIAASLALLITGLSIGVWYGHKTGLEQSGMSMSDVSDEYAELEQYYIRDISSKREKLSTLVSHRDEDLNEDLDQMDNVMVELREELANVPPGNREQVVRAMIENYKAKAAILGRVLEHLEQQQPATINSGNHEVKKI